MKNAEGVAGAVLGSAPQGLRAAQAAAGRDVPLLQMPARSERAAGTPADDLAREVYCILGMPIDAIGMPAVLSRIDAAAAQGVPFVLSTPNLNFLVNSQADPEFRESLLLSDLCPTDGMPIVWIARLTGVPVEGRIAGSDIFEALKRRPRSARPLKMFFFGAKEGVAAAASRTLNDAAGDVNCVGWICPGFGTVDEMSQDRFIDEINDSRADFLVASVGAKKGQLWLQQNHGRLRVPIRAHLGATINFQAGTVRRAPYAIQKSGLEWLWRIKEEPYLWARYWHDGGVLLRLMLTHVLPLAIAARRQRRRCARDGHDLVIEQVHDGDGVTLRFCGDAIAVHVDKAIAGLREALASEQPIMIDLSATRAVDARFLGLLLMVRKQLKGRGAELKFMGIPSRLRRAFRRNGLGYLLAAGNGHPGRTS